jgi:cellulose synthase/poly-beta-1,6-N-acetylglucosamine synthase-like glycosyltransferase
MTGISVLIPVCNGGSRLTATLQSILMQFHSGQAHEIILVDDGSTDGAVALARRTFADAPLVLVESGGCGAAAALNRGLAEARFPLVAQVDQDVVLAPDWLGQLLACMTDDNVAAVQGQYVTDPAASLFGRVMGRDLQERYALLTGETGHACTGNVLYRTDALRQVGGFDESLGYGYDNDMSYRLRTAGYRLLYCPHAHSTHRWREGLLGYSRQQYGFGYGRLDVVARHRQRLAGDSVSPLSMMLHPVAMACAIASLGVAGALSGSRAWPFSTAAVTIVGLLFAERLLVGIRSALRFSDWVPLLFPLAHLVRDVAWVCAMAVWAIRRLAGSRVHPHHSMQPRAAVDARSEANGIEAAVATAARRKGHVDSPAVRAQRPSGAL